MASMLHTFSGISLGGRIGGSKGSMKINEVGIGWQSESGLSRRVAKDDIMATNWIRIGPRTYELKLQLRGGGSMKFQGFRDSDFDLFQKHLKDNFGVNLERTELATKGQSWGNVNYQGNNLLFSVDGKEAFELPLTEVAQSAIPPTSRNEVLIEFTQDSTLEENDESLVEIRFFIPTTSDGKSKGDDNSDLEDLENDEKKASLAETFLKNILDRADVSTSSVGKGIVTLSEVPILNPRGRYDIEMFPTFMKLHGKTYDYKINYDTVSRLFLLTKPDQRHVLFIVSLDPPIRQGATKYNHLIMQFPKEEESTYTLNLDDAATDAKYKDKLQPEMKGETYKVVTQVFKALTDRKVTVTGSFHSHGKLSAVKCSLKANEGYLYPLERSFFFVHKPPTYVRFEDIESIEFARVQQGGGSAGTAGASRTFDLIVSMKNTTAPILFASIPRQEYSNLFNFMVEKGLKIVTPEGEEVTKASINQIVDNDEDEDEEEDEDFVAAGDEDEVAEEYDEDFKSESDSDQGSGDGGSESEEEDKKKKSKDKGKEKKDDKKEKKKEKEKEEKKEKKDKDKKDEKKKDERKDKEKKEKEKEKEKEKKDDKKEKRKSESENGTSSKKNKSG